MAHGKECNGYCLLTLTALIATRINKM